MFLKKMTTLAVLVVGLGIVAGGVGLLAQSAPGGVGLPAQSAPGGEEQPAKGKPGVVFTLPEDPKKGTDDLPKLQGTWQAVALEHNGEKLSAEAVKKFRVVIRDNTITFDPDGNKREASFALGTNNKPKAIFLKTDVKGPMVRGIYEVTDKELKICFDNDEGKATPTAFATKADSGLTLIMLERAAVAAAAKAPEEKRYALEMKDKPWKEVMEWFADVSGLRYTGKETPAGTFTFTPPRDKQYTIPEIVDILNDALLADKKAPYLLIRRPRQPPAGTFALVPADQNLLAPIPLISLEDLDRFGRTEIVRMDVSLKGGAAAEAMAAIRKLHSPWGSATTMVGGRQLALMDTAGSLREIIKTLRAAGYLDAAPRTFSRRFTGSDSPVRGVAFSPDGAVVWACAQDGLVLAWDRGAAKERIRAKTDGTKYLALAVSPDGKRVLIGGTMDAIKGKGDEARKVDAGVMALYTEDFKEVWHEVHDSGVRAVAFSPDGKRVAAACDDGSVLIRDAETGKALRAPGHGRGHGALAAVAFSPDGKLVAAGGADKTVWLWDVATGKEVRSFGGHAAKVTVVQFSPDGRTLLTAGGGTVYLSDVAAGTDLRRFEAEPEGAHAAAFSPNGKLIVAAGPDGRLRGWQAATGEGPWSVTADKKGVTAVAFSPDGETLATAGADGEVRLWPVVK
jgi:uncharacterized protein (TIGR03067 family)